jgi:hypothetical protein
MPKPSDVFPIDVTLDDDAPLVTPTRQLLRFRHVPRKRNEAWSTPKIFGPERLILDERVLRLHKAVVRDILVVRAVWGVVWTVLCLVVPMAGPVVYPPNLGIQAGSHDDK